MENTSVAGNNHQDLFCYSTHRDKGIAQGAGDPAIGGGLTGLRPLAPPASLPPPPHDGLPPPRGGIERHHRAHWGNDRIRMVSRNALLERVLDVPFRLTQPLRAASNARCWVLPGQEGRGGAQSAPWKERNGGVAATSGGGCWRVAPAHSRLVGRSSCRALGTRRGCSALPGGCISGQGYRSLDYELRSAGQR